MCIATLTRTPMADLTSRDHDHLWHPFTQMDEWMSYQPLVIEPLFAFE